MKQKQLTKMLVFAGVVGGTLFSASFAHADMNAYRMYNPNSGEHFFTVNGIEKQSLVSAGWKYEGIGWASVSSGKTKVYRVYNPNDGEHFYTTSSFEVQSLTKVGWSYDGTLGYSAGTIPVYRMYDGKFHFYTTNAGEKNALLKIKGWSYEGIAFYTVAPEYSWNYDQTRGTDSGVPSDVHFPQFEYLTSAENPTRTYSGNNLFYGYNDTVMNFNAKLQAEAASADYENAQARQNWKNKLNAAQLAESNAKATLNTAQTKVNEAQALVNQAANYVTADQQKGLDAAQDKALLAQYQKTLASVKATYDTDNATYQNTKNQIAVLNKQGTDYVQLSYKVNLSNGGKTVKVNFTKWTYTSGKKTSASLNPYTVTLSDN